GYWCMAVQSMKPSTSIAGHEGSFSLGLIEACLQVEIESNDALYVCHDVTMPHPINKVANVESDYGTAMVITGAQNSTSLAAINWKVISASETLSEVGINAIDKIRLGNPAARCLPLLAQIARNESGSVILPYTDNQHLQVTINPCN
ncbi:MAG: beta-ketoacyl synthase chain length factor, partial [Acidiferrobacterales bacterium]